MEYQANSQIESRQIGEAPQTAAAPKTNGQVIFGKFAVPSMLPLRGGVAISDLVKELETDADMATHLEEARRSLADVVGKTGTLRHLRLAAGMSQAKLADLALTTQSYIARVESGTLDPGTDMLVRLASALGTDEVTVFSAVRTQRTQKEPERVS
jgi:DNA-binding XRE family transcriptional regulator